MACPHTAGAASLLAAKHPDIPTYLYRMVLADHGDDIDSTGSNSNYTGKLGCRLNVEKLLTYDATHATVEATLKLGADFGKYTLAPGDATNVIVTVGTWAGVPPDLTVKVTALTTNIVIHASEGNPYALQSMAPYSVTNLNEDLFTVEVRADAAWGTTEEIEVALLSGIETVRVDVIHLPLYNPTLHRFIPADLDQDGIMEIIGIKFNEVYCFSPSGDLLWFHELPALSGYTSRDFGIADIDGDGYGEIVIPYGYTTFNTSHFRWEVVEHDGTRVKTPFGGAAEFEDWNYSPTLQDVDGDGVDDVILR